VVTQRAAALAQLRTPTRDLAALEVRVQEHVADHLGYLAFSGGKDSTVVLHLARHAEVPVVWFDSGLEFPETRTYIEHLADLWDLDLRVEHPSRNALNLLVSSGWWDHRAPGDGAPLSVMRDTLIAHPAEQAHAEFGSGELWGLRAEESPGRRKALLVSLRREVVASCRDCSSPALRQARHGGVISRSDGTVAFSPVWDWSTTEIWAYLNRNDIPVNPVYERFRRLGAPEDMQRVSLLVDGSALAIGRAVWLRRGWPQLWQQLVEVLPRLREFA